MANIFKLNWLLRKLLSSCYSSRRNRQIDESRRIGSHSGTSDSKGSGKVPRPPSKSQPTTPRPTHKLPKSNAVRMHPVVRGLDRYKKDNRSLPLAFTKQRRDRQLAKSLGSQESGGCHAKRSSTIPLKVLDMSQRAQRVQAQRNRRMCWREANDSVVTRNIEKMVRDSLLNQRVRDLIEKRDKKEPAAVEIPKKCQEPEKPAKKNRAVQELLKTAIGRENMASKEKGGDKDVRISRMQTKLEWNGQRPSRKATTDAFRDTLQTRHAYHMRVVCFQARKPKELPRKSSGATRTQTQTRPTFNLAKEEQKRLDILKAEWVQLKGLENNARSQRNSPKGPKKPTDTDAMAPTDLDLTSLIVDPKSFLTKVHVKSKILSVNLGDRYSPDSLVENPDVFSNPSKSIKFGDECEGKSSETNLKEELPKLVPH